MAGLLKGTPTSPVVPLAGQVSDGGELMVIPQLLVVVPAKVLVESFTWAVNEKGPATEGVPVIAPVEVFSVKPVGRTPEDMEKL
jgi:hypothetical protein